MQPRFLNRIWNLSPYQLVDIVLVPWFVPFFHREQHNTRIWTATSPRRCSLRSKSMRSIFAWNTRVTKYGQSEAACSGFRFSWISLHFGLQVKVRNRSGFPGFRYNCHTILIFLHNVSWRSIKSWRQDDSFSSGELSWSFVDKIFQLFVFLRLHFVLVRCNEKQAILFRLGPWIHVELLGESSSKVNRVELYLADHNQKAIIRLLTNPSPFLITSNSGKARMPSKFSIREEERVHHWVDNGVSVNGEPVICRSMPRCFWMEPFHLVERKRWLLHLKLEHCIVGVPCLLGLTTSNIIRTGFVDLPANAA